MRIHPMISNVRNFFAGVDAATRIRHGVPVPPTHRARPAPDSAPPVTTPPARSDPCRPDPTAAAA